MKKLTKWHLLVLFIVGLNRFVYLQEIQVPQSAKVTGKSKGFEIVFVVDVSPGIGEKEYLKLVENIVSTAYNRFQNSVEINVENKYSVITFSEFGRLLQYENSDRNNIIKEIMNQFRNKNSKIYLHNGLSMIFDLIEDNFPQKVGIALFISSGSDRIYNLEKSKNDAKRIINSLRVIGFTVFSIYLPVSSVNCRECMTMVSEWAKTPLYLINRENDIKDKIDDIFERSLNIEYSSPIKRSEFDKIKLSLENMLKNKEFEIAGLKAQISIQRNTIEASQSGKGNLSSMEKSINKTGLPGIILIAIILSSLIAIFTIFKKRKLLFSYLKRKIMSDESNRGASNSELTISQGTSKGIENWIPEYPAACRCKNRIDNREIVAFLSLSDIINERSRKSSIKWLDLCCGNGNILAQIEKAIGEDISRIEYYGYDIDKKNIDECKTIIHSRKLNKRLAKVRLDIVNLDSSPIPGNETFDIITLLNVLHEINPFNIYHLMKNALSRLKKNGLVIIVDMVRLPHREWNAVTWTVENLQEVISYLVKNEKNSLDKKISIPVFERTVDIFALKLHRKNVKEEIFHIWESKKEIRTRLNIITRCLQKKRNILSDQLGKIYYEKGDITDRDDDFQGNLSRTLWEYWSVCECLSKFNETVQ